MLPIVRAAVSARFPGVTFIGPEAFGNIHGPQEREVVAALPARLAELGVHGAVVSVGA
jgi:hypothetical protein